MNMKLAENQKSHGVDSLLTQVADIGIYLEEQAYDCGTPSTLDLGLEC